VKCFLFRSFYQTFTCPLECTLHACPLVPALAHAPHVLSLLTLLLLLLLFPIINATIIENENKINHEIFQVKIQVILEP
jgi:hypothetical protein